MESVPATASAYPLTPLSRSTLSCPVALPAAHPSPSPEQQPTLPCPPFHPPTCQGVDVRRQGGHQRLALPRPHLSHLAFMQHKASQLQTGGGGGPAGAP